MELGYLWLIPVSICLNSSLYLIQKHFLIKWFCRTFLSSSVQLECDLKHEGEPVSNGTATSNGQLSNGQPLVKQLKKYDSNQRITYNGKKLVTDGEVNGVAME